MFSSNTLSTRHLDINKAEQELAQAIKKATTSEETAPKAKHVRTCIVFTQDFKTSRSFWSGLQSAPLMSDEVQCFKALITIHKVIREGHPNVLKETFNEIGFIQSLGRGAITNDTFGYGLLIRGYVDYLLNKLNFHRENPEFPANFDYDDYLSMRGVSDPNAGYETIGQLCNLSERQDQFHRMIFRSLGGSPTNECKISALVPLIQESYAVYTFIKSMLTAMHQSVEFKDALAPLRSKFSELHENNRQFYYECSQIRYLTSLITIPELSMEAPYFVPGEQIRRVESPRPTIPPPAPAPEPSQDFFLEQRREYERLQQEARQRELLNQQRLEQERLQQQRAYEELLQQQQRREQEEFQRMQQNQMQRQVHGRLQELEQQLFELRGKNERDLLLMKQYEERCHQLEREVQLKANQIAQQEQNNIGLLRSLEDQVNMWKTKYDALAKMYAQLRQEHLDMLNKYKQVTSKLSQASEAVRAMERMKQEAQAKNVQVTQMAGERDRAQAELSRLQKAHQDELMRLRKEVENGRNQLQELSHSKGAEVANLVQKFEQEKRNLDQLVNAKVNEIMNLQKSLDSLKAEHDTLRVSKDEEIQVLQSAMDQTLMALQQSQSSTNQSQSALQKKLVSLNSEHSAKLNKILDSIFLNCIEKIDQSVYDLESHAHQGSPSATPEHALSLIESTSAASNDFSNIYFKFLSDQAEHSEVISCAINFSQLTGQLMNEIKGITRLAEDDTVEQLISTCSLAGKDSRSFFDKLLSSKLANVPTTSRPEVVAVANQKVQHDLTDLSKLTETLVVKDAATLEVKSSGEDLGDLVEREMLNAAKAIEAATARLSNLMNKPADPKITSTDRQVHSAILDSAMAITNAIAHLIKCATASQQEIVAQGRGSSTKTAFYKKNNRWTEGLISAAKAVAVATNFLVEAADGVIHGTHSLEQLMVACNEVSAATAQLVAASRVKANLHSKTQDNLEMASKAVTDASKELVRAVKALSAKQQANQIDLSKVAPHEFKVKEMEQQVQILKLEKELAIARSNLAQMRKHSYHFSNEVEE